MRPCHMTAVTTSQLWFLDLQVYNMLVNVLKILLKTLLYSLNNVFESLILLNAYLLENTKIIDMFFWAVLRCLRVKVIDLCVTKSGNV